MSNYGIWIKLDLQNQTDPITPNITAQKDRLWILRIISFKAINEIFLWKHTRDILGLCEEFVPGDPPEFFFDRNPENFGTILEMYRYQEQEILQRFNSDLLQNDKPNTNTRSYLIFVTNPTNIFVSIFFGRCKFLQF